MDSTFKGARGKWQPISEWLQQYSAFAYKKILFVLLLSLPLNALEKRATQLLLRTVYIHIT